MRTTDGLEIIHERRDPRSRPKPTTLGICQWTQACPNLATRMQPHRLMSPVPVCTTCIHTYDLH